MLTTELKCVICDRPVGDGDLPIGRVCKARLLRADLTGAKPFQVQKALDLIVDRAIVRVRTKFALPVFKCVGSDGVTTYLTGTHACTCPAGIAGRLCYHQLAARMVSA